MGALKVVQDNDTEPTITVPPTVEDLRSVAAAFLSTGWTLAAAVWAWTESRPGKRSDLAQKCARFTIKELSEQGVRGLGSRNTVAKYRAVWQSAIDAGLAASVEPGDVVSLPDAPFGLITGDDPQDTPETPSQNVTGGRSGTGEGEGPEDDPDDEPVPVTYVDVIDLIKASGRNIDRIVRLARDDESLRESARAALEQIVNDAQLALKGL